MHTYFYLLVILIGSLEPFQVLCRAQAWMWDPGPYYERDTLVALVYLAVVASLLHFAEVLVEDTGEPSYPRPLRRMNPRRRRRLLQGISIWGPGRPSPRPNALKMCLRELRAFLAFEAHRIGRRRVDGDARIVGRCRPVGGIEFDFFFDGVHFVDAEAALAMLVRGFQQCPRVVVPAVAAPRAWQVS